MFRYSIRFDADCQIGTWYLPISTIYIDTNVRFIKYRLVRVSNRFIDLTTTIYILFSNTGNSWIPVSTAFGLYYSSWANVSCSSFTSCNITTNQDLIQYVDWIVSATGHPCGETIGDWDVSRVKYAEVFFNEYFQRKYFKVEHVSVASLCQTFRDATSFTGDGVSNWNSSRVIDLKRIQRCNLIYGQRTFQLE